MTYAIVEITRVRRDPRKHKHQRGITKSREEVRVAYALGWKRGSRADVSNPYPPGLRHDAYEKGNKIGRTREEQQGGQEP